MDAEERLVDIDLDVGCLLPVGRFFQHIAGAQAFKPLTRTEGQYMVIMTDFSV